MIEIMIVVFIIALVAAFAIVSILRSKIAANATFAERKKKHPIGPDMSMWPIRFSTCCKIPRNSTLLRFDKCWTWIANGFQKQLN